MFHMARAMHAVLYLTDFAHCRNTGVRVLHKCEEMFTKNDLRCFDWICVYLIVRSCCHHESLRGFVWFHIRHTFSADSRVPEELYNHGPYGGHLQKQSMGGREE